MFLTHITPVWVLSSVNYHVYFNALFSRNVLLQVISLSILKFHILYECSLLLGYEISQDILRTMKNFQLGPDNYIGGSYDGQYFYLKVPELLDEALGFTGTDKKHSDWDPLH
jgi:hypothetical protein